MCHNIIKVLQLFLNCLIKDDKKIDVKRIKGKRNDYYRIRIGEYRVIYAIINDKIVVVNTILAGARGDIYKKMGGLK